MWLVNCKREKRILPRPQGRPVDLLTTRRWMGNAFIHSIVRQSTALTAHHPNKRERVYGFSLSPQWKLPQGAWCLSPQQSALLIYPSHIPSRGKEKMPEGLRRQKWPPGPVGKAALFHAQALPPYRDRRYSGQPGLLWGGQGRLDQGGKLFM